MAATVAPFRGRGEMPRPKVAMRRIKEVLRLKEGLGLSDTAVSRSVRIARSTVKEYLDRAAAAGLKWETVAELSEEELDRRLFAAVDTRHWDRPLPDWEAVEKELRGRGVTLRLLWLEYLSRHPEGYRYTQLALASASEKNCRWRSGASTHISTSLTAFSADGLSRGFLTRAGTIATL